MPFLRFPLNRGKALMRHYAGFPAQRHNVGASPFNLPQFSKKKITAWFYGLPLLFRKKSRLRFRKNNYRFRSVIFTSLDYQLFSVKRSSLRSERRRSELLFVVNVRFRASFLSFIFHMRLRRYFISAALETFFGNAFLSSFGTLSLGAFVCGKREALNSCFMFRLNKKAPKALFYFSSLMSIFMCTSLNCFSSTQEGAFIIKS